MLLKHDGMCGRCGKVMGCVDVVERWWNVRTLWKRDGMSGCYGNTVGCWDVVKT